MNQNAQTERELIVPLRPNTNVVATTLLFAFIGGVSLFLFDLVVSVPAQALPPFWVWLAVLAASAMMVPALVCLFYHCHARLVLSETGLRWRTWGDWRQVSWDAVEDYYDLPLHLNDGTGELMTLKSDAGIILLDRRWPESDAVRVWVQARVTAAKATEWGVLGQRTTESDAHTFSYLQQEFWNTLTTWFFVLLVYTASTWVWIARLASSKSHVPTQPSAPFWTPGEFWLDLVAAAFIGLIIIGGSVILSLPLLIFVSLMPTLLDSRRRRQERITTTLSGIAFDDGRRQFSAVWDEVTGYFLQPSANSESRFFRATAQSSTPSTAWRWMYVVETQQGAFEYSSLLDGYEQLNEILKQHGLTLQGRGFAGVPVEH